MSNAKPCALLMNDVHVDKDNIAEFHKNWDEAISICVRLGIYDIIIGGDLWTSRAAQNLDTLLAVREAILKAQAANIRLTLAEGNHDLVDQEALNGYNRIFDGYKDVEVIGEYGIVGMGDFDLYVMSYFPENGSFTERFEKMVGENDSEGYKKILYIHEGIRGGLAQATEDELPANIFSDFDAVLVGHYHDRKIIPGTKIEYVGSSRQHNFGEDEEKGYTILNEDGSYYFIKNEVNIRYKNIEVDYPDLNEAFYEALGAIRKDPRYRVKVKVKCLSEESDNVNKDRLIEAGANKVEILAEKVQVVEIDSKSFDQKYDKDGIKEEYASFCNKKEYNSEMGLTYLDKIR